MQPPGSRLRGGGWPRRASIGPTATGPGSSISTGTPPAAARVQARASWYSISASRPSDSADRSFDAVNRVRTDGLATQSKRAANRTKDQAALPYLEALADEIARGH